MKVLFVIILMALPVQVSAQSSEENGRDLMAEALRLFMRGLMAEMEPALDDLSTLMEQFDSYHPPEMLPNGDIIIRRKTPDEIETPGEEIEL